MAFSTYDLDKYEMDMGGRDGICVAVLYSPSYGGGWFSWNEDVPACLFDPDIVALVLQKADEKAIQALADSKWPDHFWGGARDLTIKWVPKGYVFRVFDRLDGYEQIDVSNDWIAT